MRSGSKPFRIPLDSRPPKNPTMEVLYWGSAANDSVDTFYDCGWGKDRILVVWHNLFSTIPILVSSKIWKLLPNRMAGAEVEGDRT